MENIINILLDSFDIAYMFAVNVLTYIVIKMIDELNGEKAVPVWQKRMVAVICGLLLGLLIYAGNGYEFTPKIVYSFILSLVTWDTVFKPIVKYFKHLDYKKDD